MRLGGLILWLLFLPLVVPAIPAVLFFVLFASEDEFSQVREMLRAIDQLCNAAWFSGSGRESCSSHAWRARGVWWADFIIWLTDKLQAGHCQEANRHEQPIVDFIEKAP